MNKKYAYTKASQFLLFSIFFFYFNHSLSPFFWQCVKTVRKPKQMLLPALPPHIGLLKSL